MPDKRFAIVDIETTGGKPGPDRITEIAIILYDGHQVIDSFESLVNPERSIPYNITQMTGISNEMVAEAPKFYEVAKQVVEMTQGAIFVAHNVSFDYNFIKHEFQQLGYSFRRRKLCTVRLSRKVFPGLRSYSLGNLIKHFDISVTDRHRAMADPLATACGVYYFYDKNGDVVYVGKSVNIKKRAMQHFAAQTPKATKMQRVIHDISYELTGSELIALLLEATEIKRISPRFNSALRNRNLNWCIHRYTNESGYTCFTLAKTTKKKAAELDIVARFSRSVVAKGTLRSLVRRFELCACLCELESSGSSCFQYQIGQCYGAYLGKESADTYNERADLAAIAFQRVFEFDMLILSEGRTPEEQSVVLIEDNQFGGFGYVDKSDVQTIDDLKSAIKFYPHHNDYLDIILTFVRKNASTKIIKLNQDTN